MIMMIDKTLKVMYCGGFYDYVVGGFHCYIVDLHWNILYFEKMFYDNVLLMVVYVEVW